MFKKLIGYAARIHRSLRQFLIKIYLIPPFDPACPTRYVILAEQPVQDRLAEDEVTAFQHAVDAFMTHWRVPDSEMNIIQAMALFSNDQYECNKLYFPKNQAEREGIQYCRMFEIILCHDYVFVAMFIAASGIPEHYEEHRSIHDPDLDRQRKARYLDEFTGLIYRVLPEPTDFVYDPERPVVVYKLTLPADHPLRRWCPVPIQK